MKIDILRKFFMENCPLLRGGNVKINYLSHKPYSFSVSPVGGEETVKKYADGGCLKQLVFRLSARFPYDEEDSELVASAVFLEELSDWIKETSKKGILPEFNSHSETVGMEVLSSGEMKKAETKTALYELKARVLSYEL
ncbi:MAG: hypothetical protein IJC74_02350 [Clostridia bacterium]|nr:hypothetical protein [Clostridia bacterium]